MGQYWLDGREVTKEEYESLYTTSINTVDSDKKSESKEIDLKPIFFLGVILLLAFIAIIVFYMVNSVKTESFDIVNLYTSLQGKRIDSKTDFAKALRFVTVDSNGNISVKVEYTNGYEDQSTEGSENEDDFGGSSTEGELWSGESLAFEAMDMYNKFTYTGKGTEIINLGSGVKLYSGIPWSDDGTWYQLDLNDVNEYYKKNLGAEIVEKTGFHYDNHNDKGVSKDGVICAGISWLPIYSFLSLDEHGKNTNGNWNNHMVSEGPDRYGVVILEKNAQTFYLPIASGGDVKGHTWPGGFLQTYIGHNTKLEDGILTLDGGYSSADHRDCRWNGTSIHHMKISMSEFVNGWKTNMTYQGTSMANHPHYSIELHNDFVKQLKGYKIKGYIIHKGD